jgi:NAD(P)-dependent dehydrogenase (short-subunit alcohol dehydrogenase family)
MKVNPDGRVAVVTGASRGLGEGLLRAFQAAGMRVAGCARSIPTWARGVEPSAGLLFNELDVTDARAMDEFAVAVREHWGRIDLWVNNAGVLEPIGVARELDPEAFAEHLAINVGGVFNGSRAFLRVAHAAGIGGTLVNISSGAAHRAYRGWAAYCAGKAAVDQLSRVLAQEEAAHGIRVFSVAPGIIETDMQKVIRAQNPADFPDVSKFRQLHTDGLLGDTAAPAAAILRLAFGAPAKERVVIDIRDLEESQDS